MSDELVEDGPLTPEEVLTFGPCVEAQVWTPVFVTEARSPIAVMAGRPKFGPVFNEQGIGKAALIRPCVSRGRRVRGLRPVYTPQMLEKHSGVFAGWPMFMDHVPPELAATLATRGRSTKELGGQVLSASWHPSFRHSDDERFGYRPGATMGEVYASPLVRGIVGENPDMLHTSIAAWPTAAQPGPVPWRPSVKGMLIEGIRSQPQGSVDYVVRGGAGGRLLLAEGLEDEGEWPQLGEWAEPDKRFVVSLAESLYASRGMELELPTEPGRLKGFLQEHAPHLLPALAESDAGNGGQGAPQPGAGQGLSREDVVALIESANEGVPTVEEFEARLQERFEEQLAERESQRHLSEVAIQLIESAEGLPASWKSDLKSRYVVLPSGPAAALLVEGEETDSEGQALSEEDVIRNRVKADLERSRELIREVQGKPRVTGQGGAQKGAGGEGGSAVAENREYRGRLAEILGESEDGVLDIYGKVEG